MRHLKNSRGSSIVEILVVMVVLFIGIMSVMRLFPSGFSSVKRAESMTFASRLAQFEIERWKNNAQNLPDGILPINTVGGTITVMNDLFPGPPIVDNPDDPLDPTNNALVFKRVVGETTRIPFSSATGDPTYMLAYGPIDTNVPLVVRGGDLSRRLLDSTDSTTRPWEILAPYQYAIDYSRDHEKVCFPLASNDRLYYLKISWWEQSGSDDPVLRNETVQVTVNAGTSAWIDLQTILPIRGNFVSIEQYSDTASRGFWPVTGSTWSSDPYEFRLVDPIMGIIAFNPNGYTTTEFSRPLEAKIDYDILDTGIIRDDKQVPNSPNGKDDSGNDVLKINLTLRGIKETDESVEPNGDLYKGLPAGMFDGGDSTISHDICVIDIETGYHIGLQPEWIDYQNGIVSLPVGLAVNDHPLPGRTLRFLYKAEGDWSVQFQKAYSTYTRSNGTLDYKSYDIDPSNYDRLLFTACNGNNTVSVDYDYIDLDTGLIHKVVGECHKISDVLVGNRAYVDLNVKPNQRTNRIYSVTGISVRARVIWRDGDRWRNVDLDTTLTRKTTD